MVSAKEPIVMRVIYSYTDTTQHGRNMLKFKSLVEKYTDGKMQVKLYSNGREVFFDQLFYHQYNVDPKLPKIVDKEQQIKFIRMALEFLEASSLGYGFWTWRDYVANLIYNPGFEKGFERWKYIGRPILTRNSLFGEYSAIINESNYLVIEKNVLEKNYTFSFFYGVENETKICIRFVQNGEEKKDWIDRKH